MKKLTKKDKINQARAKARKAAAEGNVELVKVFRAEERRLSAHIKFQNA